MKDCRKKPLGLNISIINRAAQSYFYHELKPFNIGPGQQAYLLALQPEERISQDQLAQRLQIDRANVTRALKVLEENGYICRIRSIKDKRSWEISLSDSGVQVRSKIQGIARRWLERLKEPLSEEDWNQLERSLQTIASSLNQKV